MKCLKIFWMLFTTSAFAQTNDSSSTGWFINNNLIWIENFGDGFFNPAVGLKIKNHNIFIGAVGIRKFNDFYFADKNLYPGIQAGYTLIFKGKSKNPDAILGTDIFYLHTERNSYPNVDVFDISDSMYYPVDVAKINLTYFGISLNAGLQCKVWKGLHCSLTFVYSWVFSRKRAVLEYNSGKSFNVEDGQMHSYPFSRGIKFGLSYYFQPIKKS